MNEELDLVNRALKHYASRLCRYRDSEDFLKQIRMGSDPLAEQLKRQVDQITTEINELLNIGVPSCRGQSNWRETLSKYTSTLKDALKQYEEDLCQIQNHIPVGLRSTAEAERDKATKLLQN